MSDTAGSGSWNSSTNIYVSVATAGSVAVGQMLSLYQSGASVAAYTARITAVSGGGGSAWTITLSNTSFSGSKPSTGTTYFAQVGGAWQGPNGTVSFPLGYVTGALTDAGGDWPRINLQNGSTYSVSAAMTYSNSSNAITVQGYNASPGDGGKATISGGSGTSFILLTASGAEFCCRDLVFSGNGSTGSANGVVVSGSRCSFERCVFTGMVGSGVDVTAGSINEFIQCEFAGNNTSNTASNGGCIGNGSYFERCTFHNNTGSSSSGCLTNANGAVFVDCIFDSNGLNGIRIIGNSGIAATGCSFNGNTSSGIAATSSWGAASCTNSVFVSNGAYGIDPTGGNGFMAVRNCAFYSNTSGQVNTSSSRSDVSGSITLTGTPFVSASTGNFALNNTAGAGASCRAAGIGAFTQTQTYTASTTSSPDVGASQVSDLLGGGGSIFQSSIIQGGGAI
jgi:hypothetical protein